MTQAEWNNSHALRHFSIVRKLDGRPFPPGKPAYTAIVIVLQGSIQHGECVTALGTALPATPGLVAYVLSQNA